MEEEEREGTVEVVEGVVESGVSSAQWCDGVASGTDSKYFTFSARLR